MMVATVAVVVAVEVTAMELVATVVTVKAKEASVSKRRCPTITERAEVVVGRTMEAVPEVASAVTTAAEEADVVAVIMLASSAPEVTIL